MGIKKRAALNAATSENTSETRAFRSRLAPMGYGSCATIADTTAVRFTTIRGMIVQRRGNREGPKCGAIATSQIFTGEDALCR